jgi:hypothetical protein
MIPGEALYTTDVAKASHNIRSMLSNPNAKKVRGEG